MQKTETILEKAAGLTATPGVYLMKDHQGIVIYVGKAKSLRNRVRSYFQRLQDASQKTRIMVSKIADIETIATRTEKEALILENNLIKKYRPRYNVIFRDDKEYPYLRLSVDEAYPNLTVIRKPKKDGALYFGPFAASQAVRETLKVIHKIFPLRKCRGKQLQKDRPCMYYQLGQCLAPCCRKVDHGDYFQIVKDVRLFLQGLGGKIIPELKKRMDAEAESFNYEKAAQIRDRVAAIEKTLEKQAIVSLDFVDRDVFSFISSGSQMGITILFVRGGRMIGSRSFFLKNLQLPDDESLSSFIAQYYHQGEFIPREIIAPLGLDDRKLFEEWLKEKKEARVKIVNPQRGAKKELLKIATRNAAIMFNKNRSAEEQVENILKELQGKLYLRNYPRRIECFDISNIMGTSAAGAMVVFEDGVPFKAGYRRFRIKTVQQPNDYAMMYEMLRRHLKRATQAGGLPDLMIVDGGKGQLNILRKALQEHDISTVDAVALAKGKRGVRSSRKPVMGEREKVFLPKRKNPVIFPKNASGLLLLQRIRDEAHRFAVSHYKTLKKKKDFTSAMEKIPGIGSKTVKAVLTHFGSIDKAGQASAEELTRVPAVTPKRAEILYAFFHSGIK